MLAEASSRDRLRFFEKSPRTRSPPRSMSHRKNERRRWQLATGPIMAIVSRIGGIELFHTSIPPSQSFTLSPHQEKQFHIGTQAVSHRNPTAGRVRSLCLRANLCEVYRPFCAKSWCSGHFTVFSFLMHGLVCAKSRCTGQR